MSKKKLTQEEIEYLRLLSLSVTLEELIRGIIEDVDTLSERLYACEQREDYEECIGIRDIISIRIGDVSECLRLFYTEAEEADFLLLDSLAENSMLIVRQKHEINEGEV